MNNFLPLPEPAHRGPPETGDYFSAFTAQQMRDYVAADRAARQAGQEPSMTVAFDEGVKEPRIVSWNKHPTGTYWLYAAPQPAAQPAQVPLTVDALWKSDAVMAINAELSLPMALLAQLVKVVEQAHGITATQGATHE